jgi:RNA polymerase subunit RPABC4/transcription elongation factor Spt4
MFCKNCGRQIENSNFCPYCGTPSGIVPVQDIADTTPESADLAKDTLASTPDDPTTVPGTSTVETTEEPVAQTAEETLPTPDHAPEEVSATVQEPMQHTEQTVVETPPAPEEEPAEQLVAETTVEPAVQAAEETPTPVFTARPVTNSATDPVVQTPAQPMYVPETPAPAHDLSGKFKIVFSDKLFLTIAVLISISVVFTFIGNFVLGFLNVFSILFTIACWMLFATAKSSKSTFSQAGLKLASGTALALWIVQWVYVGLIVVITILVLSMNSIISSFTFMFDRYSYYDPYDYMMYSWVMIIVIVFLIIIIAAMVLLNIFFYMKLHKFTKSVCVSAETGIPAFQKVKAVRQWLFVLGVILAALTVLNMASIFISLQYLGVMALGTVIFAMLSGLCQAAIYIVASLWVKKYFPDC